MSAIKSSNEVLNANELDNKQNFMDMLNQDNLNETVEKIPGIVNKYCFWHDKPRAKSLWHMLLS